MTENAKNAAPSDEFRERLLDAMLEIAPEKGWTQAAADAAANRAGLTEGQAMLAAPGGAADLLEAFGRRASAGGSWSPRGAGHQGHESAGKGGRRCARLSGGAGCGEASREARGGIARQSPDRPQRACGRRRTRSGSALGDKSTDFNWYTKRMILSGVIGSTVLAWLGTDDASEVDAFLMRRIQNVMDFEKAKGQAKEFASKLPDPLDLLGRKTPPAA